MTNNIINKHEINCIYMDAYVFLFLYEYMLSGRVKSVCAQYEQC